MNYKITIETTDKDFVEGIQDIAEDYVEDSEERYNGNHNFTFMVKSYIGDEYVDCEGCGCCGCCEEEFDFSEPFDENGELIEFDFGTAIQIMKQGGKVSRKGWNGKKQYIELATNISYVNADDDVINCEHDAIGNQAIAFVGTSGVQMGWLASQADMLADDWCIHVDKEEDYKKYYEDNWLL